MPRNWFSEAAKFQAASLMNKLIKMEDNRIEENMRLMQKLFKTLYTDSRGRVMIDSGQYQKLISLNATRNSGLFILIFELILELKEHMRRFRRIKRCRNIRRKRLLFLAWRPLYEEILDDISAAFLAANFVVSAEQRELREKLATAIASQKGQIEREMLFDNAGKNQRTRKQAPIGEDNV